MKSMNIGLRYRNSIMNMTGSKVSKKT
jgi:hypothetical protein